MFLWESLLLKSYIEPEPPQQGLLYTWGWNINGITGQNTDQNTVTPVPTQVGSDSDWQDVDAGGFHMLGIKAGYLYSWGSNSSGRTGLNTNTGNTITPTQVQLQETIKATDIGVQVHSHFISNGKLYTSGDNTYGKTGVGIDTATNTTVTTQVGSFSDWEVVDCGSFHSLGIRNGYLYSWGINSRGRTGLNTTAGNTTTPTQVDANQGWTHVSAGYYNSLAIKNGYLYVFGSNINGVSGQGTTSGNVLVPTLIDNDNTWTDCSAGFDHSLAIKNGYLYSCGNNASGGTGQGTTSGNTLSFTQIGSSSGWTHCSAGARYSLAINNGALYSFGEGSEYQTGLGSTADVLSPTQVGSDTDWIYCAASNRDIADSNSLGIRGSGAYGDLYVWGFNGHGFLPINSTGDATTPTFVNFSNVKKAKIYSSASNLGILAIDKDNNLCAQASNLYGRFAWLFSFSRDFIAYGDEYSYKKVSKISAGYAHSLVIANGALYGWGSSLDNKLGFTSLKPVRIIGYSDWTDCSAGFAHTLVIRDGKLYSCGLNESGATGQGTTSGNTLCLTQVGLSSGWTHCSAGSQYSLAINNGALYGFGAGATSQLGISGVSITSPTQVGSDTNWTFVKCSSTNEFIRNHSVGISNNKLYTWGHNNDFKTAQNTGSNDTSSPTQVGSDDWIKVSAYTVSAQFTVLDEPTNGITIAINSSGYLYTVGDNAYYVTGLNIGSGNTSTLTQIGSDNTWFACSAGRFCAAAIKTV